MKATVRINNIRFSDGTIIEFEGNEITVFVGPNNSGKSASLKEMYSLTRDKNKEGKVIKDFELVKEGGIDELLEVVKTNSKEELTSNPEPFYNGYRYRLYGGNLSHVWSNKNELKDLHPLFVNLLPLKKD